MRSHRFFLAALSVAVVATAGMVSLKLEGAGGAMTQAANAFLGSLDEAQAAKAKMAFDDPRRLDWHFIPKPERKGLQIKEMTPAQRKRAHELLHAGLSEIGYEKATAIMGLEAILHELEKSRVGGQIRDPERYFVTIFGEPSATGRWGWSIEGHHLSLNFVVDGGKLIAATPAFFGANPVVVQTNLPNTASKGTRVLAREELLGFELMGALTNEQRAAAIIADKAPADVRGAAEPQAPNTAAVGLPVAKMTREQARTLKKLLETYAGNMPEEVALAWLGEIETAGLEKVHFAWAGATEPGIGHYYRVQGPTFVLELVNVQADPQGNVANHLHSVWRNLMGDFGITL